MIEDVFTIKETSKRQKTFSLRIIWSLSVSLGWKWRVGGWEGALFVFQGVKGRDPGGDTTQFAQLAVL